MKEEENTAMDHRKILYLHIGMPKTGTSSLQLFLMQNQEALARHGFAYPMMPGRYPLVCPNRNAHFLVGKAKDASGCEDPVRTDEIEKQSFELLENVFQINDKVILSEEAIWNTYKPNNPRCIRMIRSFCQERNIELKLIVYLRRQDYYLESYWKQKILKCGARWSWKQMIKKTPKYIVLNYYKHLEQLAKEVGRENVLVQLYYEKNFDLCYDFLKVLAIQQTDLFEPLEEKINPSMNNNYAEIKRIMNGLLSEDFGQRTKEQKWLKKIVMDCVTEEKTQYKSSMFSEEERHEFMEGVEKSNRKIAREYMGRDQLFDDIKEQTQKLPTWTPDNHLQYEDTVAFFGKALLEIKREQEMHYVELKQRTAAQRSIFQKAIDKCRTMI